MKKMTQGELSDLALKIKSRNNKYTHDAPISPVTQSVHISNVIYAPGVSLDIYELLLFVMISTKSNLITKDGVISIESTPISENDIINSCDLLMVGDKNNRKKRLKKSLSSLMKKELFIKEHVLGEEYYIYKQVMISNESLLDYDELDMFKGTDYGNKNSYTSFYFEDLLKIILLNDQEFKYADKLKMIALYIAFCYHARDYYHQKNIIKDKRITNKPVVFESLYKIKERASKLGISSGRHENVSTQLLHSLMDNNIIAYYLVIHKSSKYPTYVMSRYPDGMILEQYINYQLLKGSIKKILNLGSEEEMVKNNSDKEQEEVKLDAEDMTDLFTDEYASEDNTFIDEMDEALIKMLGEM